VFTGWTIEKPRENPEFKFDERLHDPDMKIVLGKKIHNGGMGDGKEVIELLAKNPNTAKFISTKLARRLFRCSAAIADRENGADISIERRRHPRRDAHDDLFAGILVARSVSRKNKDPYELVISAAAALGSDIDTPMPLVQWTGRIGEPLYQCQPRRDIRKSRCVGEYWSAAEPVELFAGTCGK